MVLPFPFSAHHCLLFPSILVTQPSSCILNEPIDFKGVLLPRPLGRYREAPTLIFLGQKGPLP